MQESGDVHIVDASNGTIAYEYVAKAKINSNWACDRENQRILIVGDVGKACLFDMSFISQGMRRTSKFGLRNKLIKEESFDYNESPVGLGHGFTMNDINKGSRTFNTKLQ